MVPDYVLAALFCVFKIPIGSYLRNRSGGDEGIRTPDLRRAKAALSQLSYIPGRTLPRVSGPFRART
jgi:hypothetical protein